MVVEGSDPLGWQTTSLGELASDVSKKRFSFILKGQVDQDEWIQYFTTYYNIIDCSTKIIVNFRYKSVYYS